MTRIVGSLLLLALFASPTFAQGGGGGSVTLLL